MAMVRTIRNRPHMVDTLLPRISRRNICCWRVLLSIHFSFFKDGKGSRTFIRPLFPQKCLYRFIIISYDYFVFILEDTP